MCYKIEAISKNKWISSKIKGENKKRKNLDNKNKTILKWKAKGFWKQIQANLENKNKGIFYKYANCLFHIIKNETIFIQIRNKTLTRPV